MKKFLPWIIAVVVIFGMYSYVKGINNNAITLDQTVQEAWGNVNTSYQRRNDLIGNLVKTVKGAADFEKSTLEAVTNARASASQVKIDPTNITPEQLAQFNQAQSGVSSALSRLLVTVERYPDLKANQNFLKLQDELASTENQILTSRTRFNEAVKPYNNHIKIFPNNLFANMFGFKEKAYFEAVAGAEKPVDVEFDFGNDKEEAK
jgi:LemA protein